MASNKPIFRVGVLLVPPVQLLDLAAVDLFGMLSRGYLEACKLPAPLLALGTPVSIYYIAQSGAETTAELTSEASLKITASLTDENVQPGKLDVLVIPGPDPSTISSEQIRGFIRAHAKEEKTDILSICSGIFLVGQAGILDGRRVTGPRGLLGNLKSQFPKADWTEKRWERDSRLWTSSGITNGHDLVAAYLHNRFPQELADLVCAMADVGDRGQEYQNSTVGETSWWLWLIARSAWKGLFKSS